VAETLADSSASGTHLTVYFVSGETDVPQVFFDSEPDSGHSVVNLSPHVPANRAASAGGPRASGEAEDAAPEASRRVAGPAITLVEDIPGDDGGRVRVRWTKCPFDTLGSLTTISEYAVWRRNDEASPFPWEWVRTVPAAGHAAYAAVVPTLVDSTAAAGLRWSVFFISANTPDPAVRFDSAPDSGYSTDDVGPFAPTALAGAAVPQGVSLAWNGGAPADFMYYAVYRDTTPGFMPSDVSQRIGATITPSFIDPSIPGAGTFYYLVQGVDFAGNPGDVSNEAAVDLTSIVGVAAGPAPARTGVEQNRPNPFNPATVIRLALAEPSHATVEVFNARGERVRTLLDGPRAAGWIDLLWDGRDDAGRPVSSGVYLYRFTAGRTVETRKMTLMR